MSIFNAIESLIEYGISTGLIMQEDKIFTKNKIAEILNIDTLEQAEHKEENLENILKVILDYAVEKNIIQDNITERDLFDTKIMSNLIDRPSNIIKIFNEKYKQNPKEATDYYYKISKDSDYIRRYRIAKDKKWQVDTPYGKLDITINLSKPEKDPKEIARLKNIKASGYPKCALCKENEGYMGRFNHPARQNHRIIPIKINNDDWFFQYSPYVYYNEHCIVFSSEHTPMKIERGTFAKLLDFIKIFPHYFVGSNADLPITGGSILSHDHFQGGNYEFAVERAEIEKEFIIDGFEDVKVGIVKWPMSIIRINCSDSDRLIELADKILINWRAYSDEENFIFSHTNDEPHNTITPIARKKSNGNYELDLVLRNNITTDEFPFGVYHPHEELHHIKKENIGLIEVMGLAILPARIKSEMETLKTYILEGKNIDENEEIKKHSVWAKEFTSKYEITKENIDSIIEKEIGKVFLTVLEHAGVFKRDEKGQKGFEKFVNSIK